MKIKTLLFTLVLAVLFGVVLPRQAEARVTFSYFYDSLAPYGDWVDVENYGYCWHPRGMEPDWRPYTDGYWTYTDAGWTWVSYEDFGSITYHYGRWICLEDFGWIWKPDYEWAPAWVSWRQSDEYIGWAPLPPDAVFEAQTGIGVWVDRDYDIGPSAYIFCEYRHFGAPVLRNFIMPRHRNFAIINNTVNITNITYVNGDHNSRMVFNGGLSYAQIASRSQHPIETLHLVRQTDGDWARHNRAEFSRQANGQLFINAPMVEASTNRIAPAAVIQQIHAPKVDRGWSGVSNAAERQQIQQRYQAQTQGLTRATAPAWSMNTAQAQTMMNDARAHQSRLQQTQLPMQVQQPVQIQQPAPVPQQPPVQQERSHRKGQKADQTQLPMQVQPAQVQPPTSVQPPAQIQQPAPVPQQPSVPQGRTNRKGQQSVQPAEQPKVQQEQQAQVQAEQQQRKAAETEARAAREQEQAQRAQQQQVQAEQQQRKAAEAQARAAREQEQAQRAQQQQIQAEQQQRKAAEAEARAAREQEQAQRAQQAQIQAQRAQQEQARGQMEAQRRQQEQSAKQRSQPQGQPEHKKPGATPTP